MVARQALIFDLDGTLWDTTEVVARAWNCALGRAGLQRPPMTAADIASIMGLTHEQIFPRLFPDLPGSERERLSHFCYEEEERFIRAEGGRLYPGVAQSLPTLARRWPLAIVSNCQAGYIELFLEWSGLRVFADFECHGRTGLSKGENLHRVVQRNGWSRVLFVGDTAGDQQAAAEASCDFIHAGYGFGQVQGEPPRLARFSDLVGLLAVAV